MEAAAPLSAALPASTTTQTASTIQRRRAMKAPNRANGSCASSGGTEDIAENQHQDRDHDEKRDGTDEYREQDARSVGGCIQVHLADLAGLIPTILRRMHLFLSYRR